MPNNKIRTGGGTSIGGGVDTGGGDSVGRDRISIALTEREENESVMQMLYRLRTSIFGDLEAGVKGIVRELENLQEQMAAFGHRMDGMQAKIAGLKTKVEDRQQMSKRDRLILYFVAFAVAVLLFTQQWPIVVGWLK